VIWTSSNLLDLEHLHLSVEAEAITADGAISAISDGAVFDAGYHIT
jgi:hypothetical protein